MGEETMVTVLIHDAGLGAWIWRPVIPYIEKNKNLKVVAVDLPAREQPYETRAKLSLNDYVQAVMGQIKTIEANKIIVVAHSVGGVVGVEVAEHLGKKLAGFVGVAAAIPKTHSSFMSCLPLYRRLLGASVYLGDVRPPKTAIEDNLCNDLSKAQTAEVIGRFTPESESLYVDRITAKLPLDVPSLYIRTLNDNEFSPKMCYQMERNLGAGWTRKINAGHLPMQTRPRELADALDAFVWQIKHSV